MRRTTTVRITRTTIALAVLAGAVTGIPATAVPAGAPPPTGEAKTVTLITGDQVTVAKRGATWDVDVTPAPRIGRMDGYYEHTTSAGVTVIPRSAAELVRTGKLDRALFDVTGLIKQGYDDAHTKELPLLVERGPTAAALGRVTRELPKLAAVATPKNRAADLFQAAETGAAKIWLNGKAFPTLDQSVPQVGAPAAWQAGQTGAGATIAVLDTGYDAAHPDLAATVTGAKDFTGGPDGMKDLVGHGTHVAATAAGRGAASNGRYTGVAKGANLLIGKVCEPSGCPFDAIIAGMEWAAAQGADVVNMSLGGGSSDGTDLLSAAVNRISAESGTLFVIAAGNNGPRERVSSPAAADSALAVGSVNKQDLFSDFSSPGPRVGDYAVKPDISAPGEAIVAARAAGTLDQYAVDDSHAKLDGTSMAAPHVAGAAAILAAQHPDWTGPQLKAALMNTANPVAASIYRQGAGRLDVGRAVRQQVTATGSLSLGHIQWPHNAPPATQQITYRNHGTAPVTLSLSVEARDQSGQPAPAGMFTTAGDIVDIPAGGEFKVPVTFDHARGPIGTYGGHVVAKAGDTVVRTAIGGHKEVESYNLTLRATDRAGTMLPPTRDVFAGVQNLDDQSGYFGPLTSGETVRVPKGRYAVTAVVDSPIPGTAQKSRTELAEPELVVGADTVVSLDARKGNRVSFQVQEPDARITAGTAGMYVETPLARGGLSTPLAAEHYAAPSEKRDHFSYFNRAQLERPLVRLTVDAPEAFEVPVSWAPTSPMTTDSRKLTAVDVGHARPDEVAARDLRGKLALFTLGADQANGYDETIRSLAEAGAVAALFRFTEGEGIRTEDDAPIPAAYTFDPAATRLAELGTASVTLASIAASPYRYELAIPHPGGIPSNVTYRPRNEDLATVQAKYHSMTPTGAALVDFQTVAGDIRMDSGLWTTRLPAPLERTEYYSADPVEWRRYVRSASNQKGGPAHQYGDNAQQYRPGSKTTEEWGKAVVGPSLATSEKPHTLKEHLAYRDKDTISTALPLFSDAAGHGGMPAPQEYHFADQGDTVLSSDGKEIGRSGVPGAGTFTVPAGSGEYRLHSDVTRSNPIWPLSTKVSSDWTFRSATTDRETPLPLLTVGYEPKVDLQNYASGGWASFPVRVDRQPGAAGGDITLRKLEVSFDDGNTWQPAPLVKVQNRWWTLVQQPGGGFVSLRASASDTTGNTVDQTILR
ncbi:MAG: S8 family serine peptidase, partial [Kibdelosporangium sp.]